MTLEDKHTPISWSRLEELFDNAEHTAFRLESLQFYSVTGEQDLFLDFRDKGRIDFSNKMHDWCVEIQRKKSRGFRSGRVHIVTEPLSDYIRFECVSGYKYSAAAGEEVRIIPVAEGDWPTGVPHIDYWLFDSHLLVRMDYRDDGSLLTPVLVETAQQVVAANAWRDRANYLSIPFAEYEKRFDASMRPR